jgi:hypothetical protein
MKEPLPSLLGIFEKYVKTNTILIENRVEKNCLLVALDHFREHLNDLVIETRQSDEDSPDNLFINELELVSRIEAVDKLMLKIKGSKL